MDRLFYDDEFQALRDVIEQGKGYPIKFGEYLATMIFNDRFDALYFACDECSHSRPTPKAPADEEAKLVQVIESAGNTIERALRVLDNVRRRNVRSL